MSRRLTSAMSFVLANTFLGATIAVVLLVAGAPAWGATLGFLSGFLIGGVPLITVYRVQAALEADDIDLSKRVNFDYEDSIGHVEIHIRLDGEQPWGVIHPIEQGGIRQKAVLIAILAASEEARREAGG